MRRFLAKLKQKRLFAYAGKNVFSFTGKAFAVFLFMVGKAGSNGVLPMPTMSLVI
jgi:hypothetical protein